MYSRKIKNGVFVIEGLNSFAITLYCNYFYFFTQTKFGFGNKANLIVAGVSGLIAVPCAIFGGRFAQRRGYFNSLKVGFCLMIAALTCGWWLAEGAAAHIAVMLVTVIGTCFTWATLEALVAEGETYAGLQRNVGLYNMVWAGTGAVAYFIGGALIEKLSEKSLFFVPIGIQLIQLGMTLRLEREAKKSAPPSESPVSLAPSDGERVGVRGPQGTQPAPSHRPQARAKAFLRMAWLANPFSYIACNTLIAVMPGVASRLKLSTTLAGFCCSLWFFSRLAAFFGLWIWPGWHYRFRWLLMAYLALIVTFAVILLVPNLMAVIAAQVVLGGALGLIYYSSLFYSMDVGDTKGEHGGIHEAAIGFGNFAGPAVSVAALHFLPQFPNGGTIAVSAVLLCGLGGLLAIWRTTKT